jgi:L-alanine-DL-glutamate epimerase-like enolase superfamily enzyme
MRFWRYDLRLAHRWTVASQYGSRNAAGKNSSAVVFVELTDAAGTTGIGEAAPPIRYGETPATTVRFLSKVDPRRLSFADPARSMDYLETVSGGDFAAKCALNLALLDGAAKRAGQALYDFLGLGFAEHTYLTSFSIGIDRPESIRCKVRAAQLYPILKLKLGSLHDRRSLAVLREISPRKLVRVDANEAWTTKAEALRNLDWLARDGYIQFVEQPMPADTPVRDLAWLKTRSPLLLMADESCRWAKDMARCMAGYHAVNVKLVKTGGITGARAALEAARQTGLKTMIGSMIESSVLTTAAAHLAELADYLDLDGNLLITNDPYEGVSSREGMLSFTGAPEQAGLRVRARPR